MFLMTIVVLPDFKMSKNKFLSCHRKFRYQIGNLSTKYFIKGKIDVYSIVSGYFWNISSPLDVVSAL